MTTRCLVLAPSADTPSQAPAGWTETRLGRWLIVSSQGTPVVQSESLIIIGHAFFGTMPLRRESGPDLHGLVIASHGRWLAEHLWGRFLAFWHDPGADVLHAYRDPSGQIPFFVQAELRLLGFTDLANAARYRGAPKMDWETIAHRLYYSQLPTARTGLADIQELLPGATMVLSATSPARQLWSPWRDVQTSATADADALRATVTTTANLLAATAQSPLLELSGGLDSSILAAALAGQLRCLAALTVVTSGTDGDERLYARAVAEHLKLSLHILEIEDSIVDLDQGPIAPTPNPNAYGMLRGLDRQIAAFARAQSTDMLVSGTGGDNVFCALRSPAPVIDALRQGGFRQALSAAHDLMRVTDASYWQLLARLIGYAWQDKAAPDRWRTDPSFLRGDCRPAYQLHPWLEAARGRLPGQRGHIVMILRAHTVLGSHERIRSENMIFPLLAQPVLEHCLAVPSWQWLAGGRDRSVARRAFTPFLPPSTIARRSKGRRDGILAKAFDLQRAHIVERLLDGHLARAGILDRTAVEAAARAPAGNDPLAMRLLELNEVELWADRLIG